MAKINGKYEVPTLYSVSGSAHFFNKTDNGICVHRNFDNNTVDVYVQKIKHSWLGKVGVASFTYNLETRQYEPIYHTASPKTQKNVEQNNKISSQDIKDNKEELPF